MNENFEPRVYHPEQLSRRGEWIAWALALLVGGTWLFLALTGNPINWTLPALAVILFLYGMGISLANWMDRHTVLKLGPVGVSFHNGLRNVELKWDEIKQVQVFPAGWGKKVRVIGKNRFFDFRTLGKVTYQGEVRGKMGFEQGEQILQRILNAAQLKEAKEKNTGLPAGSKYYVSE